jgi:hypothetical protein
MSPGAVQGHLERSVDSSIIHRVDNRAAAIVTLFAIVAVAEGSSEKYVTYVIAAEQRQRLL